MIPLGFFSWLSAACHDPPRVSFSWLSAACHDPLGCFWGGEKRRALTQGFGPNTLTCTNIRAFCHGSSDADKQMGVRFTPKLDANKPPLDAKAEEAERSKTIKWLSAACHDPPSFFPGG